jgi:hypothetical protein
MEMWGRRCHFDDDSAFRVRVVGISGRLLQAAVRNSQSEFPFIWRLTD